ncbi:glycoside hydrolase family 30 protein [Laccaria amethystina LaAM-08-1]|uniref:Glycoside hydrolase family 30 protein n=1 Tax=Laccaria amethystina LaAM-08-1 TaxID=1095629 RepID=A0A0C9YG99_9AGAR|nr:glycoside hydrolase family 30 protein [Laccaria amethystina LaAM-08-1]
MLVTCFLMAVLLAMVTCEFLAVNLTLKQPAWMKDGGTLNGGSLQSSLVDVYAIYLLKCLQEFKSKGIIAYAISVQNEPQNVNPTSPTAKLTPAMEGQIGTKLRTLMNGNSL